MEGVSSTWEHFLTHVSSTYPEFFFQGGRFCLVARTGQGAEKLARWIRIFWVGDSGREVVWWFFQVVPREISRPDGGISIPKFWEKWNPILLAHIFVRWVGEQPPTRGTIVTMVCFQPWIWLIWLYSPLITGSMINDSRLKFLPPGQCLVQSWEILPSF